MNQGIFPGNNFCFSNLFKHSLDSEFPGTLNEQQYNLVKWIPKKVITIFSVVFQSDVVHQSVFELVHSEDREELQRQLAWNSFLTPDQATIPLQVSTSHLNKLCLTNEIFNHLPTLQTVVLLWQMQLPVNVIKFNLKFSKRLQS